MLKPVRFFRRWKLLHILFCCAALGLMVRLFLAAEVPLIPDEAYYWLWSRHMQAGYLDHPFMVALWIRLGTLLWGDTPFGVRFCGLVGFVCANIWLFLAARRFFPSRDRVGVRAILLLNVTLMASVGLVPATPDVPLFVFLCLMLWALSGALQSHGAAACGWWVLCGIGLGLAADSKYTALLPGLGLVGFVLFGGRGAWRMAGPWLGGGAAALMVLPTLVWNERHGWAGLLKQGGRASYWHPERAGQFLGELLAGQLALLTPWVAVLCFMGLWRARHGQRVLLWLSAPALLLFLVNVTGERVQPNWVWVLYPALILAGAAYAGRLRGACMTGGICTVLVYAQCLTGWLPLPPHMDPIARLGAGWSDLAAAVAEEAEKAGISCLATDDYALASILAFQKPQGLAVLGKDSRWGYVAGLPHETVRTVLYLKDGRYGPVPAGGWAVWRKDRKRPVRVYLLEKRHDLSGWIVQRP